MSQQQDRPHAGLERVALGVAIVALALLVGLIGRCDRAPDDQPPPPTVEGTATPAPTLVTVVSVPTTRAPTPSRPPWPTSTPTQMPTAEPTITAYVVVSTVIPTQAPPTATATPDVLPVEVAPLPTSEPEPSPTAIFKPAPVQIPRRP
jgi:hypothetical protein